MSVLVVIVIYPIVSTGVTLLPAGTVSNRVGVDSAARTPTMNHA